VLSVFRIFGHGYKTWGYPGLTIISMASFLHFTWAILLLVNIHSLECVPLAILYELLGSRWIIAGVLGLASICGVLYVRLQSKGKGTGKHVAWLLPQQAVLFFNGGAGIYMSFADYFKFRAAIPEEFFLPVNTWAHTLAAEMPVIILSILYTVAFIELALPSYVPRSAHVREKETPP
jgi:hypothetical protein